MAANQSYLNTGNYTGAAVKEGVMQLIYQITPEDTPLLSMIGRKKAMNVKHEWLKRVRGAREGTAGVHRAVIPGDLFQVDLNDFENLAVPTREVNYCEIFRELPRVDETTLAQSFHGLSDIMADQIEFRMVDFAIHIEERFWNGADVGTPPGPTPSGAVSAWHTEGLTSAIATNSDTATTFGGSTSLSDRGLVTLFNEIWAEGGKPQDLFSGPNVRGKVNSLSGNSATQFLDVTDKRLINTVSVYEGSTQTVFMHLTRDLADTVGATAGALVVIDKSFLSAAWLREPFVERLPRMAGDERARIEGQVTLEYGNEAAHGEMTAIRTEAGDAS